MLGQKTNPEITKNHLLPNTLTQKVFHQIDKVKYQRQQFHGELECLAT
jgi:hypothetical protein